MARQAGQHEQLIAIYVLMKWGPTSANSFPARIVFVTPQESKKRLPAVVFEGNRPKVMAAPATAIIGFDSQFYDLLPRLFPHRDMRSAFVDKPEFAQVSAFPTAVCFFKITSVCIWRTPRTPCSLPLL
jgi:hypothetical protein